MYEVVSGNFYLPKLAGPPSENTFYSAKTLPLSDKIGSKIIQCGFFEQFDCKHYKYLSIPKKQFLTLS